MKEITKHVLKNLYDFGQANPKAILGMVLRDNQDLKKNVPKVLQDIEQTIKDNSNLSKEEIKKKLEKLAPELLKIKKEKEEGPLKPLPNAKKGKVVLRIAPSPSGALHIGHAYGAALNHTYAKMYDGKLILRIEDTNPENIYDKAYDLIPEDLRWITNDGISQIIIQSNRLGIYYDYAEKLVGKEKAYVCTCNADSWRELKNKGEACQCRSLSKKEQHLRYAKMFNEYAEGEAVLRLKTDIQHKNPAMRDFGLLRINEHIHPKTGKEQRVWPLMVFSVAIDDHELGLTHVLNGKDQMDNAKKETIIMKYLGWKPPLYQHWGFINFKGFQLSSSQTKIKIEQNEYHGWDDIRLPFLPALRSRGYTPAAFMKFAQKIGLSQNDKTVSMQEFWKMVDSFNREVVEPEAHRYFFVEEPKLEKIQGSPKKKVEIDLHPDFPEKGKRILSASEDVYISMVDFKQLADGRIHRLMDFCNFVVEKNRLKFHSEDYEQYKSAENKGKIIHWVPKNAEEIIVVKGDGREIKGFVEKDFSKVEEGQVIQFERMFFVKVKKSGKETKCLYLHK